MKNPKEIIKNGAIILLAFGLFILTLFVFLSLTDDKEIEEKKTEQESQQQKDLEFDKLKQEVEALKNQKPQIITKTISTDTSTNLPAMIAQWTPRVAKVSCKYVVPEIYSSKLQKLGMDISPEYGSGSGFLVEAYDSQLGGTFTTITTNDHVVSGHNGFSHAESCVVKLGSYTYSVNQDDIRTFSTDSEIETIDGKWYLVKNLDAASIIIKNPDPEIKKLAHSDPRCSTKPAIGESIVILGFPSVGSQKSITATEGIISGLENSYYVTSAKVEHGNSGGAAFWLKNNCYIGIPSFVVTGRVESLARILDIKNVFSSQ